MFKLYHILHCLKNFLSVFRKVINFCNFFRGQFKCLSVYLLFISLIMPLYPSLNFFIFNLVSTIQFRIVLLSNGCLQSFFILIWIIYLFSDFFRAFFFDLFSFFFFYFFLSFFDPSFSIFFLLFFKFFSSLRSFLSFSVFFSVLFFSQNFQKPKQIFF